VATDDKIIPPDATVGDAVPNCLRAIPEVARRV
jgi:hypothetical protein